jgi:hypothetical protein
MAIEPAQAEDAADADVPFVDVVAAVTAIGYCSPRGPAGAPEDTRAEIWAIGASTHRLEPILLDPAEPHPLGGFWAPPPDARTRLLGIEVWRPGRYAIRLVGTAFDRWIGIEVVEPPGPGDGSPSPNPSSTGPRSSPAVPASAPGSPP